MLLKRSIRHLLSQKANYSDSLSSLSVYLCFSFVFAPWLLLLLPSCIWFLEDIFSMCKLYLRDYRSDKKVKRRNDNPPEFDRRKASSKTMAAAASASINTSRASVKLVERLRQPQKGERERKGTKKGRGGGGGISWRQAPRAILLQKETYCTHPAHTHEQTKCIQQTFA